MILRSALRFVAPVSLAALAIAWASGCGGVVTRGGGDGGDGGGGGDSGDTVTATATATSTTVGNGGAGGGPECDPAACSAPAIAMSDAQFVAITGGDPTLVTDSMFLLLGGGSGTPTCASPSGTQSCGGWNVTLTLATSMLAPGTYPLSDPEVDITMFESFAQDANSCAGGGGGGLEDGQIEIYIVTPTTVEFGVTGVPDLFETFNPNGTYKAARCP